MSDAIATITKAFDPDAPRFLALEFLEPPAMALLEIKRADFSGFESTRLPTHADVTVYAANGGSADLPDLDLKALGPQGLLDAVAQALPVAHKGGLHGEDAGLLGKMITDAAAARHVSRNLEPL